MESILLAIEHSDPLWIALAFACGLIAKSVGLPPLVGFLVAGFALNAVGARGGEFLQITADFGITLLLFTIGLKLNLRSLARPEVWGVAIIHIASMTGLMAGFIFLLAIIGLPLFEGLDITTSILIGFALSFSSTVFAVKILDDLGAGASRHGQVSIGVLIVQDVAAVSFLAASTGKFPSIWALALLALVPLRHLLQKILNHTGHGELLILYGIVLALGGADLFKFFGMKGDLGALVFGMLLAGHWKANEMSKVLMGFKDVFLVGFFLSIGMSDLPGWTEFLAALILLIFVPVKVAMYFGLFTAFKLRARTAFRSSLNLANYSEFGLIVGSIAVSSGWLTSQWLATFAIALSLTFILAAPLADSGDRFYGHFKSRLHRFERSKRVPGDEEIHVGDMDVVVFGMGRVGTAAFDAIVADYPQRVLGIDLDSSKVNVHVANGRNVIMGDGSNPDFWLRTPGLVNDLKWVLLTLPAHQANLAVVEQLHKLGYDGRIAVATRYPDEAAELEELGVEFAFNIHSEAGAGFASDLRRRFEQSHI
ncbi:MAG: potassium transporter Kef [marine bacterium B5-7]|nr:MAG: potassium transporter Kef [marine bacterium B5-7]